jgi:dipeptidyl aminopeptidase/acylaminoacyl peptidase
MSMPILSMLAAVLMAGAGAPLLVEPDTVSGMRNDYNRTESANGRLMAFARSDADFAGSKILVAQRLGQGWSTPAPIEFSDDRWRDSDPWLTPDGGTLYFVSDRPTATRPDKRDLDIWRSTRRDGRWSAPEHLGDLVNGRGEELGPELHDGILYFATARRSGMGGLDIYSSRSNADGFDAPRLLPAPINSPASESDFTLSRDGRTALFWRQVDDRGLLHVSRRTPAGWSAPEALPDSVNVGPFNFTPALSTDGKRLTFASTKPRAGQPAGMADVYEVPTNGLSFAAGDAR